MTIKGPFQPKIFYDLGSSELWKAEGKKTSTSAVAQLQGTILNSHYSVSASGRQWKVIVPLCEIGLKIMPFKKNLNHVI